jgi:curved DNA-binding protein CbpA
MLGKARDPYDLLGVTPNATPAQVRRAYRRLIVVSHRSRVLGLVEHLEELKLAYETLKDPVRRRQHDVSQGEERARARAAAFDAAPKSSDSRRREGKLRAEMARELDELSRRRSIRALAANSESMRSLAREHDEREALDRRRRARRELLSAIVRGMAWVALIAVAFVAALRLAEPK